METLEQVDAARPLLIVGGNLALDFANTVDDPGGPRHFDHIGDMHRLLTWAQNRGLFTQPELRASIHEHQSEAQRDLEHLHLLRHTIQIGFTDVARGQPFPTTSWHQLRKAVANAIDHADLTTTAVRGQLHWTGPDFRIVECGRSPTPPMSCSPETGSTESNTAPAAPGSSSTSPKTAADAGAAWTTAAPTPRSAVMSPNEPPGEGRQPDLRFLCRHAANPHDPMNNPERRAAPQLDLNG
jgi:hypothetical protein